MMRLLLFLTQMGVALITAAPAAADARFAAAAELSRKSGGIAMLVMLDGKVVFEDYPNGGAPTRATELASGTKSFSGILALCAVEDGWLKLDEKIADTLTEWRDDPQRSDITVRQLLTLTSGIPGGESALRTGGVPKYAEAVAVEAVAEPGKRFSYGPNPFQVFGEFLRRKLAPRGETVWQYLSRRILQPLGLESMRWRGSALGQPQLPSGAGLSARDWAKFGESIRLDAKGILPPGKLAECFIGTTANPGYGLTWWLPVKGQLGAIPRTVSGPWLPEQTWMAAGAGGQRLVVVPSLQLVAVRLAPVRGENEAPFNDRNWLRALLEPVAAWPAKPAAPVGQSTP